MFGYISPNLSLFNEEQKLRYRSAYCGLCRTLRERHGLIGSAVLSNDMTFLALLLNALYEPSESTGSERCALHPLKCHGYFSSEPFEYAADVNIALAYHKCFDDWTDDHSLIARSEAQLLSRSYKRVQNRYPEKCRAIEAWMAEIHRIEHMDSPGIDAPVNSTGRLLGELFCWKEDFWTGSLRIIGDSIGRFIYLMDAYDDLPKDIRRGRFNPLKDFHAGPTFEDLAEASLTMMIGDATQEFETLPIVRDADILRNILYSGVWRRYKQIQEKKQEAKSKGA